MSAAKREPRSVVIKTPSTDPVINLCLDAVGKEKQTIVFCNTKRGAESQAERVAKAVQTESTALLNLSETALKTLSTPTRQCKRLALCLRKGVAFHHAGLHAQQRGLVETGFREGVIHTICSTPTLAMGLDLPAFRVIIRDVKRYTGGRWGMTDIPVLEYHQMAGRAGRPGKERYGEAVLLAQTNDEQERLVETYVKGDPEEIYSKLAVEPVLRTYVLSLIASGFVASKQGLYDFFNQTFYARQYGDTRKLHAILDAMTAKLVEWEFLETKNEQGAFVSAASVGKEELQATLTGKRVAELYLDPYTAYFLIKNLSKATPKTKTFAFLHLLSNCLELRPLLRPRVKEVEELVEKTLEYTTELLVPEPVVYGPDYDEYLMTLKTAFFFNDWIDEVNEETLLERYAIRPGEVHGKLERADWLVYAATELARLRNQQQLRTPLNKLRLRLKHGARAELLPLLQLKGVGRVRARKLYKARVHNLEDVRKADYATLAQLLGRAVAADVKSQVGQEVRTEKVRVKPGKRKGQKSMADYHKEPTPL